MPKKNIILLSGLVIVLVIGLVLSYILAKSNINTTNTKTIQSDKKTSTRGWKEEGETQSIYQLPVTVLSESKSKDVLYTFRVSPFNSPTEEFDLLLGPKNTKFSYGSCDFDEKGEIISDVTWTLVTIEDVIKTIQIGDTLLLRFVYPAEPINDQIRFKEELLKRIDNIEQKKPIDFLFPTAVCKKK